MYFVKPTVNFRFKPNWKFLKISSDSVAKESRDTLMRRYFCIPWHHSIDAQNARYIMFRVNASAFFSQLRRMNLVPVDNVKRMAPYYVPRHYKDKDGHWVTNLINHCN